MPSTPRAACVVALGIGVLALATPASAGGHLRHDRTVPEKGGHLRHDRTVPEKGSDPRIIWPDIQGSHDPMLLPEGTIWLHRVESTYEGEIYFRIRQTAQSPIEGLCVYAFLNYWGAHQCPPQPIQPELRPEMLGYLEEIEPPGMGLGNAITVSLLANAPHHPAFRCDVTISGYGLQHGYGFESVWGYTVGGQPETPPRLATPCMAARNPAQPQVLRSETWGAIKALFH